MAATKHLIADSEDAIDNRPVKKTKVPFCNGQLKSTNRERYFIKSARSKGSVTNEYQLRISSRSLQATRENGPISSRKH
ncbi:hypothetical protein IWW34DRAFT_812445 [Fusarium oxysporum f. sp. albedinis]|nr:hypothetical protein IWW34DRAFT_812445 [Fusarium oxysporum f. sp. albedinis]